MEANLKYCPVEGGYLVQIGDQKMRNDDPDDQTLLWSGNEGLEIASCTSPDMDGDTFFLKGVYTERDKIVMPIPDEHWKKIVRMMYDWNESCTNNSIVDWDDVFILDESLIDQYPAWRRDLVDDYGYGEEGVMSTKWLTKGREDATEAYCKSIQ